MSAASGGAAPRYHIIREAELDHTPQSGHRLRAYCPVHGSDHQRSLDIECEGDAAGWGVCRSCDARVFVPELAAPDVAARILAGGRAGGPSRPRSAEDIARGIIRRAQRRPAERAASDVTIGPELAELRKRGSQLRARLEVDERARAYLAARRIPLEVAQACGVGYVRADLPTEWREDAEGKRHEYITGTPLLAMWRERIVFPLGTPVAAGMAGPGYIGRSLWGWTGAELDELAHKALLEGTPGAPPRWLKTQAPAGWFNYAALEGAETAVIVEGAFDTLALLTASVGAPAVALAGTTARVDWLPPCVRGIVLALDEDGPTARAAAAKLADELRYAGVQVARCAPPADGLGKDWAARWARSQWDGLAPLYDALAALDNALDGASVAPVDAQRRPALALGGASADASADASAANLWTLARADPVVTLLTAHGYILADVYAVAN